MRTAPPTPQALTPKGRATRERIVEAAAELMYDKGVAATSLSDVEVAVNVSGSQLYHYFGDKGSLVRAVVAYESEAVFGGKEELYNSLDSIERLRGWRDYTIGKMDAQRCRGGCRLGSLVSELSDTDPAARADLADALRRWTDAIHRGLQSMQDRGELSAQANTASLATALLAAAEGGLLMSKALRSTDPLRAALDTVIDHIETLTQDHAAAQAAHARRGPR